MDRRDCLKECNNRGLPLEDFRLSFCARCVQPECTRSIYGTTQFDQRVRTWFERLFENVPQMSSEDPRFQLIASQSFQGIDPGSPGKTSEWADPRDLPATKTIVELPAGFYLPAPPEPLIQEVAQEVPREALPPGMTQELALLNTPSRGEVYLQGNSKLPKKEERKDPWAAPEPTAPGEVVVERGATVRLGGVR